MKATTASRHPLLSSLGAFGLLGVLLVGAPGALWSLAGSPFPGAVPSTAEIFDGFSNGGIDDSTILKGVAIAAWLAWAQVAVSILVEATAWVRGVLPPRVVLTGPVQPAMRRLIASAALLLSTSTSNPLPLAAAAPIAAHSVALDPSVRAPTPEWTYPIFAHEEPVAVSDPTAPASPIRIVQRRDTLWGLAQTHLGDPFRWREIYDLNHGVPQPDGRALHDPNLILIGWHLRLPDDAEGIAPLDAQSGPTPETRLAECDPSVDEETPPLDEADTELAAPGPTSTTTTTAAPAKGKPTDGRDTDQGPPNTSPDDGRADDSGENGGVPRLAPFVGGSLLAAAIVILIDRLRRARTRQGSGPAASHDDDLLQTELALRHAADKDGAARLDLALRALATGLREESSSDVSVLAVRLDGPTVEVLLDQPVTAAPVGFETTGNHRGLRLQTSLSEPELRALASGTTAPLPSLVTIGTVDGDPVLVDIETAGVITIDGSNALTTQHLRRIATELATSTWTDHLDLMTAGAPLGDISGSHRVRHFSSFDDALEQLLAVARARGDELSAADRSTTSEARIEDEHGDGWIPTLLLSSDPIDPQILDEISQQIRPRAGVGIIAPGPAPTVGWHVKITDGKVHLLPHQLTLDPVLLDEGLADAVDQILTDVAVVAPEDAGPQTDGTAATDNEPDRTGTIDPGPFTEPPTDVEFRVLGEIDVVGLAPIERRKSMEIAVYLALHPDGVTDDRLKMIFWPDGTPAQTTFNTTVSMTRSSLGTDSDEELYLPHYSSSGQRYRLTSKVTTDLERFEARAHYAKSAPPDRAKSALEDALRLVRGQPFDVSRGYEWAFAEGFVTRASLLVAGAAHQLAAIALDQEDAQLAEWAATQGLLASPGDESLYRDRMRAAHQAGNTAAIKQLMNELSEVVEANEPYDQLHPETIALFESLVGRRAKHVDERN